MLMGRPFAHQNFVAAENEDAHTYARMLRHYISDIHILRAPSQRE